MPLGALELPPMVVCEAFKNGCCFSEPPGSFPSCFYLYSFLLVPHASVLLSRSLVLAVSPHCRALSWIPLISFGIYNH